MGVKVSVIVNVHNPGDTVNTCIRSALEQTMPADDYEVIFVDDGSTDGIAERLDTIAAARCNVRTLHLPDAGSPTRGRNVGLAAATGDYVFFLDQRDRLERDALARMHQRAVETDADVLVGRLVRDCEVPTTAFARSTPRADILRDRLLTLLVPQQLFRRAFLEEQELSFGEPGGRLAEQAFVMRAYLHAKVVAVLAEHECCRLGERPEGKEDASAMVNELNTLLADVDTYVGEGRHRERIYVHWFRHAVLTPLLTGKFADSYVDGGMHFRLVQELMEQRFPEPLDRHLPVQLRAVAAFARKGRLDQIVLLSGGSKPAGLRADLTGMRWDGHVLVLGLTAELQQGDNRFHRYRADGDSLHWIPPRAIDAKLLDRSVTDVTAAVERSRIEVYVRHSETGDAHFLPVTQEVEEIQDGRRHVRVQIKGEVRLDVNTAAIGEPLRQGRWEVHVRMIGGADQARGRVGCPEGPLSCVGVLAKGPKTRLVVPCWSDEGELGLVVEPRSFAESIALVSPAAEVKKFDGYAYVVLPVPYVPPSGGPPLELVLRSTGRRELEVCVPALAEPGVPGKLAGQLVAKVPVKRLVADADHLGPGGWQPLLRSADDEFELRFTLEVRRGAVEVRSTAADPRRRSSASKDTVLRRIGRRLPGARHVGRLAHAGRRRYLS